MAYYIEKGSALFVTNNLNRKQLEKLPVGYYTVKYCDEGYYLDQANPFVINHKIYGEHPKLVDRILTTFQRRQKNTGVLLNGEKGSGKTLVAKMLSAEAFKRGMSVLLVNDAHCGDGFNHFLSLIQEPCVVIFDEFEKVYDHEKQPRLLTLLDGVYPTEKLFVLTSNNKHRLDENLTNRPGRVFYSIDFDSLSDAFIREYAEDNLEDKSKVEQLCRLASAYYKFNYDMLQAIVEDMNRYNENPVEVIKYINAKPTSGAKGEYIIELLLNGVPLKTDSKTLNNNPLTMERVDIWADVPGTEDEDGDLDTDVFTFTESQLVHLDTKLGKYIYESVDKEGKKLVLTLTKKPYVEVDHYGWVTRDLTV